MKFSTQLLFRECRVCGALIHSGRVCFHCRRQRETDHKVHMRRLERRGSPRVTKARLP